MSGAKYLNGILKRWGEFFQTHKNIEKAIREVLEENEKLKEENEDLKEDLRELIWELL